MQIPAKLPGLRKVTIIYAVYGLVWMALEGKLWQVVLLAMMSTAVLLGHLLQKMCAGRVVSWRQWVAGTAVCGLLFGLLTGLLTLIFMAVKTGLHGHGPEFSLVEINWIVAQIPLWTAVGLLSGVGIGLITVSRPSA